MNDLAFCGSREDKNEELDVVLMAATLELSLG